MAATDARPVPIKNTAFRYYFSIRKNDGTLITSWTGADSEVSLDGAVFADCTNEATEIGTSGCGYIDLTSSEMNADSVFLKITVTNTSALTMTIVFFPQEAGDIKTDVETIKTQTITCAASVTVYAHVGTSAASTAQTGDGYAIVSSGTHGNAALKTLIDTLDDYVDTEVAAIKAKTDNLPAAPAATGDIPSVAAIADGVWDEATSGHSTAGTTGKALTDAGSAGDPWSTAVPGAYSAGTAGYILGTNLNATVSSRSSHSAADVWSVATRTLTAFGFTVTTSDSASITAILADTNELQTDWANGGRLDLIIDTIAANVVLVLADTGTDGVVLSAATCNKIADHSRRRTQANVEASSDGDTLALSSLYGAIQQMQEAAASGATLTVYRTDGTTSLGTRTLATDPAAEPVTGVS